MKTSEVKAKKAKSVDFSGGWNCGFIAAVCIMIKLNGQVTTEIRDLWRCSPTTLERHVLESLQIDENDIETLLQYKEQLK